MPHGRARRCWAGRLRVARAPGHRAPGWVVAERGPRAIIRPVIAAVNEQLASFFQADPHGAIAVYLFGSAAGGEDSTTSDVDVASPVRPAAATQLDGGPLALAGDLERALQRAVDVIVPERRSADLVHRVLRDGAIVLNSDRARRLRFEVARRNEFFESRTRTAAVPRRAQAS